VLTSRDELAQVQGVFIGTLGGGLELALELFLRFEGAGELGLAVKDLGVDGCEAALALGQLVVEGADLRFEVFALGEGCLQVLFVLFLEVEVILVAVTETASRVGEFTFVFRFFQQAVGTGCWRTLGKSRYCLIRLLH
jgi:hypothetical protein